MAKSSKEQSSGGNAPSNGPVAPAAPSKQEQARERLLDLERVVGMEFVRATEAGALSAYKWMGKGDKESADFAACDAIRGMFDSIDIAGTVTIGEGIKDEAPGIFKSEKLGTWAKGCAAYGDRARPDRRHDDRQQRVARFDQCDRGSDVRNRG
jgi:hypothetical protein